MNTHVVIGLIGFATYLGSYAMLQLGQLDGNGFAYTLANVSAAAMVLVSLFDQFNLASALIQVSWIGFGLIGLFRHRSNRRAASVIRAETSVSTRDGWRTEPASSSRTLN